MRCQSFVFAARFPQESPTQLRRGVRPSGGRCSLVLRRYQRVHMFGGDHPLDMAPNNCQCTSLSSLKGRVTMNTDSSSSLPSIPMGRHLVWTTDTPTKPGWYWSQMRAGRAHVIELVSDFDSARLTVAQTGAYVVDLEAENHRWAGPLSQPQGGMLWASNQPSQAGSGREQVED